MVFLMLSRNFNFKTERRRKHLFILLKMLDFNPSREHCFQQPTVCPQILFLILAQNPSQNKDSQFPALVASRRRSICCSNVTNSSYLKMTGKFKAIKSSAGGQTDRQTALSRCALH